MDPIPSPEPFTGPLAPDDARPLASERPDIPREAMRVAAFIVRRMALDMREIEGEWGYVEPWHLHERGWSPQQVAMYGQLARDEIGKQDSISATGAQGRPIFTSTERRLFAFSLIGALALIGAGALEIARPGTLPAFNAVAVQPAPQAVAFPVCRPEGA
jgi:hypothetical protein